MKKHNFSAGPSVLPEVALENAAKAIFDSYYFVIYFKNS